jgi:hypothetical protein
MSSRYICIDLFVQHAHQMYSACTKSVNIKHTGREKLSISIPISTQQFFHIHAVLKYP